MKKKNIKKKEIKKKIKAKKIEVSNTENITSKNKNMNEAIKIEEINAFLAYSVGESLCLNISK